VDDQPHGHIRRKALVTEGRRMSRRRLGDNGEKSPCPSDDEFTARQAALGHFMEAASRSRLLTRAGNTERARNSTSGAAAQSRRLNYHRQD
jgi:hypothetical protein